MKDYEFIFIIFFCENVFSLFLQLFTISNLHLNSRKLKKCLNNESNKIDELASEKFIHNKCAETRVN